MSISGEERVQKIDAAYRKKYASEMARPDEDSALPQKWGIDEGLLLATARRLPLDCLSTFLAQSGLDRDKQVMLALIADDRKAFGFASKRLKLDETFALEVYEAGGRDVFSLYFESGPGFADCALLRQLTRDQNFMLSSAHSLSSRGDNALGSFLERHGLKSNASFMLKVIARRPDAFKWTDANLRLDKGFMHKVCLIVGAKEFRKMYFTLEGGHCLDRSELWQLSCAATRDM